MKSKGKFPRANRLALMNINQQLKPPRPRSISIWRAGSRPLKTALGFTINEGTNAQTLTNAQDERLSKLGDAGAKGIHQQIRDLEDQRESYFQSGSVRDLTVESRFNAKIRALRTLLRPALIIENPPFCRPCQIDLVAPCLNASSLFGTNRYPLCLVHVSMICGSRSRGNQMSPTKTEHTR